MLTRRFLQGRHREQLTPGELQTLESSMGAMRAFGPREELVRHGEPVDRSLFLIEGFVCRYMDGLDGSRQLVAVHVPGDFVDLHGYPMRQLDHDVETLTGCTMALYPHANVERMVVDHPNLGRMLWFSTMLDAAMHREWIFRLGRLDAMGRVAHFFAEIGCRLQMVEIGNGLQFPLPMQQADLASACGITVVHANRVLRQLREKKIVLFANGEVNVLDREQLHAVSEFDPAYLYPTPQK
jgi:CRP-like cAMP-binding protein